MAPLWWAGFGDPWHRFGDLVLWPILTAFGASPSFVGDAGFRWCVSIPPPIFAGNWDFFPVALVFSCYGYPAIAPASISAIAGDDEKIAFHLGTGAAIIG